MRMLVPRKPVCRQSPWIGEVLAQASQHICLRLALHQVVPEGEEGGRLHRVEDGGLELSLIIEELLSQILPGGIGHLLIECGITACGSRHVAHHRGIDSPVGGAEIVPVGDGIGS